MLTDLHLHKYLEGMLSDAENQEVEALIEKNPVMKARLETLKNQSLVLGKPTWQRVLLERGNRSGSRTRYTTLLPALLMLVVVLMVTQHWFAKPGENSTFTMSGGNGEAMELLYNSTSGWRYLDVGFRPGDTLSFSVRDGGSHHVAVYAIYGKGEGATVTRPFKDDAEKIFSKVSAKPVFTLAPLSQASALINSASHGSGTTASETSSALPSQIVVCYGNKPLTEISDANLLEILANHGNERGGLEFQYQVFSSGH